MVNWVIVFFFGNTKKYVIWLFVSAAPMLNEALLLDDDYQINT